MWTIVVSSIFLMTVFSSASSKENNTSLANVKPLISDFKGDVHRILERARMLKKRQLEDTDSSSYKLKIGLAETDNLPYLSSLNIMFWISVHQKDGDQVLIGTTEGILRLFQLSDESDKLATEIAYSEPQDVAIKAKAFSVDDEQWFAVLHKSGQEYYIRMYQRDGRGLEAKQQINLSGFSDIELLTMKGIHYLVVVSYNSKIGQSFSYQGTVTLYNWPQTQFDAIASRTVYGARSVTCWVLDGSLYIAVAQEIDDEGRWEIGSPIFLYNSKEENRLVLWETLQTIGPRKIQHFEVANNHYLVVIGKQDAVIYWWSSAQFLKWQTLSHTAEAIDMSVVPLGDGEVAIVIVLSVQALFYTLDSSGLYIITLTKNLDGTNLQSFQTMFSGKANYALALFEDKKLIYRLTIDSHFLPTIESMDRFQECLVELDKLLEERQTELDTIKKQLDRVWLKGSNQTVISKVIVEGSIISNHQSQVRDIIIVRYANIPDVSMSNLIGNLAKVGDLIQDAKTEADRAVTKSTRQEITGTNHFKEHVFVPSLAMESSSDDITINGVPVSRLHKYALRKTGDQVFSEMTSVSNLYSEAAKVSSLNGILIDDFLLLHGVQMVVGNLNFSSAFASDVVVENLNSIPIDDVITTNKPQNIEGLKTFVSLKANSVDVSGETNEVDLSAIHNKIATVNDYNEFRGQITFQNPLNVDGDMFLTQKINKIVDLETLIHRTVTRDTEQDLAGHYTFKGKQIINGDLLIDGLINSVFLDNLLTLSSDQEIYADMIFSAPAVIQRDLIVDKVNSIDLSEEVLRKSLKHQFITGRKTFSKDIQADFVDMTDYVTLDGVDPSFLVQDIVQHRQGVVDDHNTTVLKDVEVLNTLTILGDLNGIDVGDFSSSVWSKSTEQDIPIDIKIGYLRSKKDIQVFTVNGLNLDSDIVHTFMDETIDVEKTFNVKTVTHTIHTNGTINGIDVKSYKIELEKYRNEWEVQGTKSITSLGINGNLEVTMLNQLNAMEIMKPNVKQVVTGPVELTDIAFVHGNVNIGSLSADILNDLNLKDFFRNAVLASQSYKPLMNKSFKHLAANNMTMPSSSRIAGVSLDELFQRVVTLRDPQIIEASKEFAKSLKFDKLINTANLNGLILNDYLDEVVMTDEVSKISNKFLEEMKTTKASITGLINGMRIEDLTANVFYKSDDNMVVTGHFIVEGDIDVGHLFAPTVDGINWKDLIFNNEDEVLEHGWFLSNVQAEGDIFVKGTVNGCDLSQISDVLYTNKSTQVIKKNLNVQNIVVIGNLIVKKTVNDIPLEDLKNLITISDDQNITSNAIIDANLIADGVYLSSIGNTDIAFILEDAVKHSVPQEIKGKKTFTDGIDLPVLTTSNILVAKVNGVDMEELESTTVWKNGYQAIAGDKILRSLIVDVAFVNGYLNGLKLPDDVVKVDISEHISHPTFFMSDVYVSTDVVVYGFIDEVDINILINRRVTLSTEQNLTSELTFKDDVILYDDLIVDGTVNDIVLELVANTEPTYPIQGYKIFRELHASGSVTASSVNQFDITKLSKSILQYNKNEHINEVQIFEKPVHIHNSVIVRWINNIPVDRLSTTFSSMMSSLQSALGYLSDLTFDLQKQLTLMMSASQDQIYRYSYFTLFQELNVGPIYRILIGYNIEDYDHKFSHSLVMWTLQKHCIFMGKCCHQEFSYWSRVTRNGLVMTDSTTNPGRYYPISDSLQTVNKKEYFIWTNSTDVQSEWCKSDKNGRMILAASNNGLQEVYIDIESSALLSDVKYFRKGSLYAVVSFYYDPKSDDYGSTIIYAYENERYWSEHQILSSFGILSLDLITYTQGYKEEVFLALGSGMKTEPTSYSAVYKWSSDTRTFDLLQNIPSRYIPSILWIQKERDLFLSMASVDSWPNKAVDCGELVSGGQIDIFSYKENYLKWIQSIPVEGVVSMTTFSVEGDTYLAAASIQHQTIYIFEWRGFSGFVQIQTISAEARHLNIYYIDDDVYMTFAAVSGPSKILKLVRKGKSSATTQSFDLITSEQKDEIYKEVKGC